MNDAYCHANINTAEFNYDGGDCCECNVNMKCYSHEICDDGPLESISD